MVSEGQGSVSSGLPYRVSRGLIPGEIKIGQDERIDRKHQGAQLVEKKAVRQRWGLIMKDDPHGGQALSTDVMAPNPAAK